MKALLIAAGLVTTLLCACKQETFHDQVQKDTSNRIIDTNNPELGTDPNVRLDTRRGTNETTSGNTPGSTTTPRGADTLGGGSAAGAGGAGPGYRGDLTNAPK